ncbi:MAG: acetate/propionate family kinase [candidate division Zixibacteria bacterium]|nr:acetate/propionate family kinase [candidate division Zixibacteria bacterium]
MILIANVGSTSFKFRLFDRDTLTEKAHGRLERIGNAQAPVQYRRADSATVEYTADLPDYASAIRCGISLLTGPQTGAIADISQLSAVGFKPVHALAVAGCVPFTDDVLAEMEKATPLAPAHNPPYAAAVRLFRSLFPSLPLYGLFEPTFHQTVPDHTAVYGVPYEWIVEYGIRRYGFHGASHRYIAERVPALLDRPPSPLKTVSCHLGGSSSVCAVRDGASIDTSMGLSPQSGLMQSTRCGDLDPFGVLMMLDRTGWTTDEMRTALCKKSGLKGVSGIESGDMRDILAAEKEGNPRARLAVEAFTGEVRKYIGAYAATMGGLDVVVFTGGMGERSAEIRARICAGLEFLGIRLDKKRNKTLSGEGVLSRDNARVAVMVVPADEERIVAREVAKRIA